MANKRIKKKKESQLCYWYHKDGNCGKHIFDIGVIRCVSVKNQKKCCDYTCFKWKMVDGYVKIK